MFKTRIWLLVVCGMTVYLLKGIQSKEKADEKTYKGKIAVECVTEDHKKNKYESTQKCCKGAGTCRKIQPPTDRKDDSAYCLVNTEGEAEKVKECCNKAQVCSVFACHALKGQSKKAENIQRMEYSKSC